jgi:hypothetical protein
MPKIAHTALTETEIDFCNKYVNSEYSKLEDLANLYGVTTRTLYNWLEFPHVKEEIKRLQDLMVNEARAMLKRGVRMAAANLLKQANKGDVRASEDILEYAQVIEKQIPLQIVNQNVQNSTYDREPTEDEITTLQRIIGEYKAGGNKNRLRSAGVNGENLLPGTVQGQNNGADS